VVEDLLDQLVERLRLAEHLVEGGAADEVPDGGLGDLVDRGVDVLDLDDRLHRVDPAEVGDGCHADRDVVLGDDLLGLDGHGDGPLAHLPQLVDQRDHEPQPRLADLRAELAQPEHDALLVLMHDGYTQPAGHLASSLARPEPTS
jgi:hypothetical protein